MRVVSLTCSNTEIVCALGCADLLVGVDDHSDRPVEVVSRLPRVGPDLQVDIDAVADLEPDLVLASLTVPGHERVLEGLEAAGLEFLAPEPVSLEDIYTDIRVIARALEVADAGEALISEMRSHLSQPQTFADPPKLLVQWWNRPTIAPGRDSWVTDLIDAAGGTNPLADNPVKSTPLTDEQVALIDPDAVILAWCGVAPDKYRPDVVCNNPAWQDVRAVRKNQVYCVPEAYLGRPGPSVTAGFDALKQIVRNVHANR